MKISLKEWAEKEGIKYNTAHYRYKNNKIPFDTYKDGKNIYIDYLDESGLVLDANKEKFEDITSSANAVSLKATAETGFRRNRAGSIANKTDRYHLINEGETPFHRDEQSGFLDNAEKVELCQKAYYNFAIFRNTIDLMTEFSSNQIYFKGNNKVAIKFFNAWSEIINLNSFQNRFFREYFRSGNVFTYVIESKPKDSDRIKLNKLFETKLGDGEKLPYKYTILNPINVKSRSSLTFENNTFYKRLTPYEIERIRNPLTDQDNIIRNALLKNLTEDHKKILLNERSAYVTVDIPLDPKDIYAIFYKKQDYEPFAMPMGFPVLKDLNAKQELKQIDMAVARTMQQVILLVTMGETIKDKPYINPDSMAAIKSIFQNESVGRVLVADYTTEAKFVIPQISDILTEEKYKVINKDIEIGLNNILVGGDQKFSDQSIKVDVFLERLNEARQIFLDEFLKPEMKKIAERMKFKSIPDPEFKEFRFKNNVDFARVYTRLGEIGILTPDEVIKAFEQNRLPTPEESRASQAEFKELKEKDYYEPTMGGSKDSSSGGRPAGTKNPTSDTKKETRVQQMAKFGINKMSKTIEVYKDLSAKVYEEFENAIDEDMRNQLCEDILMKYSLDKVVDMVAEYKKDPVKNLFPKIKIESKQEEDIKKIAIEHDTTLFQAAILYHSKVEDEDGQSNPQ